MRWCSTHRPPAPTQPQKPQANCPKSGATHAPRQTIRIPYGAPAVSPSQRALLHALMRARCAPGQSKLPACIPGLLSPRSPEKTDRSISGRALATAEPRAFMHTCSISANAAPCKAAPMYVCCPCTGTNQRTAPPTATGWWRLAATPWNQQLCCNLTHSCKPPATVRFSLLGMSAAHFLRCVACRQAVWKCTRWWQQGAQRQPAVLPRRARGHSCWRARLHQAQPQPAA